MFDYDTIVIKKRNKRIEVIFLLDNEEMGFVVCTALVNFENGDSLTITNLIGSTYIS